MTKFNSREVVERLSDVLNMHDHVRPGSDRLKHAASILAAALESAKREEREKLRAFMNDKVEEAGYWACYKCCGERVAYPGRKNHA